LTGTSTEASIGKKIWQRLWAGTDANYQVKGVTRALPAGRHASTEKLRQGDYRLRGGPDGRLAMIFLLVVVLVGAALYFLPTVIAGARNTTHLAPVIVINLLLGWTFVGWVVALALAVSGSSRTLQPAYPYPPPPGPWSYPAPPPPRPGTWPQGPPPFRPPTG
jgi:hypothetical protein